jgi:hypothetical protein
MGHPAIIPVAGGSHSNFNTEVAVTGACNAENQSTLGVPDRSEQAPSTCIRVLRGTASGGSTRTPAG